MKVNLIITILLVLIVSCKKDKSCENCDPENALAEATIVDTGVQAADGCDWAVKTTDNIYYHPDNLPATFKQNNLPVSIRFELTGETFICGIAGTGLPVIHILELKK